MAARVRLFIVVTLAVFVSGVGVTGASALWSQQSTVSSVVTTGAWEPERWTWSPAPTFTVTNINKGGTTTFTLTWTAPPRQATSYVLQIDGATVVMNHQERTAQVTIPNGNTTYSLRLQATDATGATSHAVTRTLEFHPGGSGSVIIR